MMESKLRERVEMPECAQEALAKIRAKQLEYNRQYLKRQLADNEAFSPDFKLGKQPPEIKELSPPIQPTIEWTDLIAAIDREMARIGWDENEGINYLQHRYGKKSRQLLTDEQILDFYDYLKAQPEREIELILPPYPSLSSLKEETIEVPIQADLWGSKREEVTEFNREIQPPPVAGNRLQHPSNERLDNTYSEYVLIEDAEQLEKAITHFKTAQAIGIDTETTGLDPHTSKLRLIQLATDNQPVLLVDCFQVKELSPLQPLLASKAVKIGHNLKFDLKFFRQAGLTLKPPFFDTQIASQLLKAGLEGKYSLQAIANEYLKVTLDKTEQVGDWKAQTLTKNQLAYAAEDAKILLPLRNKLKQLLIEADLVKVAKIEFDCLQAVAEIEDNGMLLDLAKWESVKAEMLAEKEAAAQKLRGMLEAGNHQLALFEGINTVNLDSNQQVLEALQRLGIPITSTGKKKIAPLAGQYPAIDALLEYRHWAKALSAFGESLPRHINPVTGRLHPDYWQMGSAAGRFSCSHPNLQQIPRTREVRQCFTARPGYQLAIADYSQIELRIAAEIASEAAMIEAYRNGQDLHRLTASLILDKPVEEVTKGDRQLAKAVNFGLLYGMGAEGFKNYAESNYGVSITLKEAETFRDKFFKAYQGLARWHQQTRKQMYRDKEAGVNIETRTLANRRRLMPEPSLQQILNTPVQGTGADMLKLALSRLPDALRGTDARIIGTVHDEIILECPKPTAARAAEILSAVMVEAGKEFLACVPVEAEALIGDSWADKN